MSRINYIILLMFSAISAGTIGWIEHKPIRTAKHRSVILTDVDSHLPSGHIYGDSDKVTHTHEGTHGINSGLRQKFGGTGKINGIYVLNNTAIILPEPKTTLQQVSQLTRYKGNVFNLYLKQQQQYWNNEPLYVLDEAIAYANGSAAGIELKLNRSESLIYAMEFCFYLEALIKAIDKYDQNYKERELLVTFIGWHIKRVMFLIDLARKENNPMYKEFQTTLIDKFKSPYDKTKVMVPILPMPDCIMLHSGRIKN